MTPKQELTCSVIVCTNNHPDEMNLFLSSLRAQTELPKELIIVMSSDHDMAGAPLFRQRCTELEQKGVHVVYLHTPLGRAHQRNQAVMHVTAKIIYFFNDDVIIEPNYLQLMQTMFARNPRYAGGMGYVRNHPYCVSWGSRLIRSAFLLSRMHFRGIVTASGMPTYPYGTRAVTDVQVLDGCCMAYRRAIFARHRFDEFLGPRAFMEDVDFSYRIARYAPLFYNPDAQMHCIQSSHSSDAVDHEYALFIRSYSYLFFKNIYPGAHWKIIPYYWSLVGLFVQHVLSYDRACLRGYMQGLREFHRTGLPN